MAVIEKVSSEKRAIISSMERVYCFSVCVVLIKQLIFSSSQVLFDQDGHSSITGHATHTHTHMLLTRQLHANEQKRIVGKCVFLPTVL